MVTATKEYRKVDLDTTTKHYNPETGAWDGQLAAPGMPTADEPTERKDWPKVFPRMAWADAVVDARRYRRAQAAVFHRMTIRAGTPKGCTESVGNIAKGLGIDRRSVQRAIKAIKADGYMAVEERTGGTYICVPNLDRGAAQCHPQGAAQCHPKGILLLTPKGKEGVTGLTPFRLSNGHRRKHRKRGHRSPFFRAKEERGTMGPTVQERGNRPGQPKQTILRPPWTWNRPGLG